MTKGGNKMKENDIMLGDWVRRRWTCSDTWRKVVKDFQVTEIRKNGNTLYAWGKNGNMGRVEDLEPIPLTPEILEKNGFKQSSEKSEHGYLRYYIESILIIECHQRYKGRYHFIFRFGETRIHTTIRFIHELQHALRLCGIDLDIVI
jgi:hypothetical protein